MENVGVDHPFYPLTQAWAGKIRLAWDHKKKVFQDDADEAMRFFSGPYDWMYDVKAGGTKSGAFLFSGDSADMPRPSFCMVAGTPVRLADGTEKPIEDVSVGDEVVTHTGAARKVVQTFTRSYTGDLVTITPQGFPFPLTMTADHQMAVMIPDGTDFSNAHLGWDRAGDLAEGDRLLIGWRRDGVEERVLDVAEFLGDGTIHLDRLMEDGARHVDFGLSDTSFGRIRKSCRTVDWRGKVKLPRTKVRHALYRHVPVTPSLGRLMGLYLAEGSLYRGGVEFTFGGHEEHYAAEVLALVRGLFGVEGVIVRPDGHNVLRVKISSKNLNVFFSRFCPGNAHTKRVPAVFFNAGEDTKTALLVGWMNGDGHTSISDCVNIVGTTASPGLGRDLTVLAISCGLRANCTLLPKYRGYADRYIVRLNGAKAVRLFPAVSARAVSLGVRPHQRDGRMCEFGYMRRIRTIERRAVTDVPVYDFEVEEDHSFLAGDVTSHNCMTINKVAELVQLFGPALYHRNPVRKVTPRKSWVPPVELFGSPADPMVQAYHQQVVMQADQLGTADKSRAALYQQYLNYTPNALNLKEEARKAIDEALIKGAGVLWAETYQPRGGQITLVGSFHDSIDNLVIDPDAESLAEAKWVARRCAHPYWEVERDYGLPPESLKNRSSYESRNAAGEASADPAADYNRRRGMSNDLLVYWKVWSKMGVGGRLSGAKPDLRERAELLGDYVYLVVADGVGYPLNMPLEVSAAFMGDDLAMFEQALPLAQQATAWPTPFWADDSWPFTMVSFHWVPRQVWPMSHVKPGMGELKAINWIYSMMVSKLKTSHRDFIAIAKSSSEALKESIRTGPDYTMIEVEALHGSIDNVVKFLQHPDFNPAIFEVVERIAQNFDKRTGLTELLYAMTATQMRSAAEADSKENMATIRPDDMANRVEDAMSEVARKEAFLARWHLQPQDVAPVLGPLGAQWWQTLVLNESPEAILHGLEYRVEAGSAKKPNKARDASNMQNAMTVLFQPLLQLAMTAGMTAPINALLLAWADSIDLEADKFLLPAPPPMPPAGPGQPGMAPPTLPGPPLPMMPAGPF